MVPSERATTGKTALLHPLLSGRTLGDINYVLQSESIDGKCAKYRASIFRVISLLPLK